MASALARGIAHTVLRSGTKIATKVQMTQAIVPVASSGKVNEPNSTVPLIELKARREAELDADYFGVQYLFKSGYDTKCFLDFVGRTGDANKTVPEVFSEYPPLVQRLDALRKEIATILPSRPGALTSTKDFEEFKNHLEALKSGRTTSQNPSRDN